MIVQGLSGAELSPLANLTYDETYDGFHRKEFDELLAKAKNTIPKAYRTITRRWGYADRQDGFVHPIIVQVKDLPSASLDSPLGGYVHSQGYGTGLRQNYVIDIVSQIKHPDSYTEGLFMHETAHAVLRDVVDQGPPRIIPAWFNEGLAQSVTQEGYSRVRMDFQKWGHSDAKALLCDLDSPVDEFAHGHFGCYTAWPFSDCGNWVALTYCER